MLFSTLLQQYYDWDAKVVRTKYVPWFLFGQENRYEYTTELIQDFQQGQHPCSSSNQLMFFLQTRLSNLSILLMKFHILLLFLPHCLNP